MSSLTNNQEYLVDAEKAAFVVQTGLQNKNYAKMNALLGQISLKNPRAKYVFNCPKHTLNYLIILACILASLGSLYFLLLGAAVIIFSADFVGLGLVGLITSAVILIISCLGLIIELRLLGFDKRYQSYAEILNYQRIVLLDDLSYYTNETKEIIIRDLNKAIKYKYIPQGHWGSKNRFFMVSDELNDAYLANQPVYDYYFRKQEEDRMRIFDRTPEVKKLIAEGQSYVESIHNCNAMISDKAVSEKLDKMERIVSMIFHEVDVNPKQSSKLGLLLEYYLPTTEKLLDAYIELDDSQTSNKTAAKSKAEIEASLESINTAFESILDRFFQDKELDLSSDIDTMEKMMHQDGLN